VPSPWFHLVLGWPEEVKSHSGPHNFKKTMIYSKREWRDLAIQSLISDLFFVVRGAFDQERKAVSTGKKSKGEREPFLCS
jgi:hypothetical protein